MFLVGCELLGIELDVGVDEVALHEIFLLIDRIVNSCRIGRLTQTLALTLTQTLALTLTLTLALTLTLTLALNAGAEHCR